MLCAININLNQWQSNYLTHYIFYLKVLLFESFTPIFQKIECLTYHQLIYKIRHRHGYIIPIFNIIRQRWMLETNFRAVMINYNHGKIYCSKQLY
jgi:hypothetical protein